jgi:hypothetical protein
MNNKDIDKEWNDYMSEGVYHRGYLIKSIKKYYHQKLCEVIGEYYDDDLYIYTIYFPELDIYVDIRGADERILFDFFGEDLNLGDVIDFSIKVNGDFGGEDIC